MYNLSNIHTATSYQALKRNGFTDAQMVEYYNFENPMDRKKMFSRIVNGVQEPIKILGTQKCTAEALYPMFMEYMNKDIMYRGQTYNMNKLGWTFEWNTSKKALGQCKFRWERKWGSNVKRVYNKRICISTFLIENSNATWAEWVDTILHEIAHAIDVQIRKKSAHDRAWKDIARSIGADPTRTTDIETDASAYKYTLTCPCCGRKHGVSRRPKYDRSCGKCSPGVYREEFKMTLTQNY